MDGRNQEIILHVKSKNYGGHLSRRSLKSKMNKVDKNEENTTLNENSCNEDMLVKTGDFNLKEKRKVIPIDRRATSYVSPILKRQRVFL